MPLFNLSSWFSRSQNQQISKADLNQATQKILMKLSDLQSKLEALTTQLDKATAEIQAEIANLKQALSDVELPAAAAASLEALSAKAQALDDINPDATTAPTPTTGNAEPAPEPAPATNKAPPTT